jgi:hypothetical protein
LLRKILWFFWPTTPELKRRQEEAAPKLAIFVNGKQIGVLNSFKMDNSEPVTVKTEHAKDTTITFEGLFQHKYESSLEEQLQDAIDSEQYELAAILRDKIAKQNI